VREVVAGVVRGWIGRSAGGPIDVYRETQRLMFDAFSRAFWGRTFPPDRFDWFQALARTGSRRINTPLPVLPPPLSPEFYADRREWYATFESLVRDARKNPDPAATDLLNVSLTLGTALSDAALAEALATNFFGGVFSCSSTVNTLLYLLARHPAERASVATAVRGLPADYGRAALDDCRPLEFALREAMRYYPAVPLYFRNSAKDRAVKLGQHLLPPDTLLFISNWYLHKYSPHWRDSDAFAPARWADGVAEANPYGSGYFFPFGRGPRACVGSAFALFVMRLVVATLFRESEPDMDPEQAYQQSFFFGVMMPKGLTARFLGLR